MKIAIIANNLRAGGGNVLMNGIVPEILKLLNEDHKIWVALPFPDKRLEEQFPNVEFVSTNAKSTFKRIIWQYAKMKKSLIAFKPDWIFGMGNYTFPEIKTKQSILFHNPNLFLDVAKMKEPFMYKLSTYLKKRQLIKSLRNVNRVYCQTESTKAQFANLFDFSTSKIAILSNVLNSKILSFNPSSKNRIDNVFRLVYITKPWLHKNHMRIVEMYEKYYTELEDTECIFSISEKDGELAQQIINRINEAKLSNKIKCIGEVNNDDVAKYYLESDALIMPTYRESFSVSYLEAMHLNCPIITSDLDFAHDICGDAAIFVNPDSAEELKNAVLSLKNSQELKNDLINRSKKQLDRYHKTWADAAKFLLKTEGIL